MVFFPWHILHRSVLLSQLLPLQKCVKTKDFKSLQNEHLCKNRGEGGPKGREKVSAWQYKIARDGPRPLHVPGSEAYATGAQRSIICCSRSG